MRPRIAKLALIFSCTGPIALHAQEFKVLDRTIQVYGFASQGFVYTDENNCLTMHSNQGSGAFTDFGVNVSRRLPTSCASERRSTIATLGIWEIGTRRSIGHSPTTVLNPGWE